MALIRKRKGRQVVAQHADSANDAVDSLTPTPRSDQTGTVTPARNGFEAFLLHYLYLKAAKRGYAMAQCIVADRYLHGIGTEQDDELAAYWYRQGADRGDARAQYQLGWMYMSGRGVSKQSDIAAAMWFQLAASQGDRYGQNGLGWMYDQGRGGMPQSDFEAAKWYRKSAKQGCSDAQFCLGVLSELGVNPKGHQCDTEAAAWYRKAAEQGEKDAQLHLDALNVAGRKNYVAGGCIFEGYDYSPDTDQFLMWYRHMAEGGDAAAQYILGMLHERGRGRGCPQDSRLAAEWYGRAAVQGHHNAEERMQYLNRTQALQLSSVNHGVTANQMYAYCSLLPYRNR